MEQVQVLLLLLVLCSQAAPTSSQEDVQAALRDLTKKLSQLQNEVKELHQEHATERKNIETWGVEMSNHVDTLRADRTEQAAELRTLKSWKIQAEQKITEQAAELQTLKSWKVQAEGNITEQAAELKTLKSWKVLADRNIIGQEAKLKSLKTWIVNAGNNLESLMSSRTGRQVAFSVALLASGEGYIGPYNNSRIMAYKDVFLNIGNSFNTVTGKFTAPVKGAYHFDFHASTGVGPPGTVLGLQKNEEVLLNAHAKPSETTFVMAGNGVSLLLEVGDTVHVFLHKGHTVYDKKGNNLCTFSGRLLFTV